MLQDTRFAFRLFRRSPASTAVAGLSIALSVGASAVVFAAVKAVLIDPLPYRDPATLVQLRSEFPAMREQSHGDWVIWNDTQELARRTRTLASIGVYSNAIFDLAGSAAAPPEALYGVRMNAALFPTLGVSPMLGRNILPEEDQPGRADVIILSYGLWRRRFQSDPAVAGRTVVMNGRACLIAGVMPPGFNFPLRREAAHTPSPYVEFWAAPLRRASNPDAGMGAAARLRPGVSVAQARQDLEAIGRALARDFPARNRDRTLTLNPLRERVLRGADTSLLLLMAAALLFLLIGAANVASLLLARGLGRRREIAIRLALGAGRARIFRQLLTESCALALAGGAGGYLLAAAAWMALPALAPVSIPRLAAARADTSVLVFALALAAVNGILSGLALALRESGFQALRRHDRVRSGFIAAEVSLAVLLVVTGAQVLAAFVGLVATDPGFEANQVLASVVLPAPERYRTPDERGLFYRRALDAVRALPGVDAAGTVDALPFSGENHGGFVSAGEFPAGPRLTAEIDVAGGEYLQAMGIRLVEGRWFHADEMSAENDAAIVNTLVARTLWPGTSAVGRLVCVFCTVENPRNWKRVVGVVAGASHAALDEPEKGNVYLAAAAMQKAQFLVVRTTRPQAEMDRAVRRAIAAIDPNQPVFLTAALRELVADSVADRRFIMMLLSATACLALALAAAGVYGVVSYAAARRTPEIGIRIALGAAPRHVLALIFRHGFAPAAAGLSLGVAASLAGARALRSVLPGLDSAPPAALWTAAALVAAAAALACWIPAHRAARTDPVDALRQE